MIKTILPVCCPPLGAGHYRCAAYNKVAGPKRDATGLAAALFSACFGALHAWHSAVLSPVPSPEPSAFRLIGSIGNLGRFKFQNPGPFWTTDRACFQRGIRRCVGRIGTRSIGERLSHAWRSSTLSCQIVKVVCVCHARATNAEPTFKGPIGVVFHQEFLKINLFN